MRSLRLVWLALVALSLALAAGSSGSVPVNAATLTVNSTADPGDGTCDAAECTLREAVDLAQAGDTITFDIPTTDAGYNAVLGVWTIRPATPYGLVDGVTLDGTTQAANQGDTNPLGPEIEVDGSVHAGGFNCFRLTSNDILRGLVINRCGAYGVWVDGADTVVAGNYIGTDPTGTQARPVNLDGVLVIGAQNNTIGGDTPADRNVISGNNDSGVRIADATSQGNKVIGNYIGTDRTGTVALPNYTGVTIHAGAHDNTIGGDTAAQRNVISGNQFYGVFIWGVGADANVVKGNYIGTDVNGTAALGNGQLGVVIFGGPANNVIGPGNTIAYSGLDGVSVDGSDGLETVGNRITGNSIHSNSGMGINNARGGNGELAPPVITALGSVSGTACGGCTVEVFSDSEDEGRTYEGTTVADGAGSWNLAVSPAGPKVTATATDAVNNTSEFSVPMAAGGPWGDVDCDGDVDAVDALKVLRHVAGLSVDQSEPCADIGTGSPMQGDVDCDGDVDAVDALKILRYVAGLSVDQEQGCTPIGG